jgi:hypothetical protein
VAVTINGNKVTVSTGTGDAVRANPDWQAFKAAPDKVVWWQALTGAQKLQFVFGLVIKVIELEARLSALEKR